MRAASGASGRRARRAPASGCASIERVERAESPIVRRVSPPVELVLFAVWCFLVALGGGAGRARARQPAPAGDAARRLQRRAPAPAPTSRSARRGRHRRRPPTSAPGASTGGCSPGWRRRRSPAPSPAATCRGVLPARRCCSVHRRRAAVTRRRAAGSQPQPRAPARRARRSTSAPRSPAAPAIGLLGGDRRADPRLAADAGAAAARRRGAARAVGTNVAVGFSSASPARSGTCRRRARPDADRRRRRGVDPGRAARLAPHRPPLRAAADPRDRVSCCSSRPPAMVGRGSCVSAVGTTSSMADRRRRCCSELIRFDTVNPPGNERAAQEQLAGLPERRRLRVRAARRGRRSARTSSRGCAATGDGPDARACLGHVDTVLADAERVDARPVVRRRRRRLRVGTRRARHEVAGRGRGRGGRRARARRLAPGARRAADRRGRRRGDRRRARRAVAHREHPDKVRCDCLLNEGGGAVFDRTTTTPAVRRLLRREGRLPLHAHHRRRRRPRVDAQDGRQRAAQARAAAGAARRAPAAYALTDAAARLPARRCGEDPATPQARSRDRARRPAAGDDVRADARRHAHADAHPRLGEDQRDPRAAPSCRSTAACRRASARTRCAGAMRARCSADGRLPRSSSTSRSSATRSPLDSPLMDAIGEWIAAERPGGAVPCR